MEPYQTENMDIYGTCLWHLRKDVELSFLSKELLEMNKKAPQTWYFYLFNENRCVIGNLYSRHLEHDQAIKCFNRAVQLEPQFAYAHTLCGHEYLLNEDLDRAANSFRDAIRIQPRHYNAWYGLACVFMKQEKYPLAEFHFKKALEIYKENALLQSHLAMVIQKDPNRMNEALERFKLAEYLAPHQPIYQFRKAHTLALLGRFEEALETLQKLAGKNVAECNVHYLMGRLCKQLGRNKDAIRCFTLAQDQLSSKSSNIVKEAIEKIRDVEEVTADDLKLFE